MPTQSPLHDWKMLLPPGIWVSVTSVFMANATLQMPDATPSLTVQLMPAGELVMVPLPCDAGDGRTVSVAGMVAANPAPIVVVAPVVTITVQVLPPHAPEYPENAPLPPATELSVTATPASNDALHPPPATPFVIVQKMPAGELVTVPDPVPTAVTATMPIGGARYVTSATWVCATVI